jgi:hypothetical protein
MTAGEAHEHAVHEHHQATPDEILNLQMEENLFNRYERCCFLNFCAVVS